MVEQGQQAARPNTGEVRKSLLYGHLITLSTLAESSAQIAFPRRLRMPDIHRQLILMLGIYGSATSKDLVLQSGREKAQVSRGLKALAEAGLIDRPTMRGAMRLSPCGAAVFADIVRIVKERNIALCDGISVPDIEHFLAMTAALTDKASSIFLADERQLPVDQAERSVVHHPPEASAGLLARIEEGGSFRDLVMPWIQGLITYLRRSGENLFLREVEMSAFEWRVLSQVEENQPINLSQLTALLARDKSQVTRMVKKLTAARLVDRVDARRTNITLSLTAAGRASYERICTISEQRDSFMFAGFGPGDRGFYLDTMAKLIDNARGMLDTETAARSGEASGGPDIFDPAPVPPAPRDSAPATSLRQENDRLKQLLAQALRENSMLRDRPR